ncbi:MAG: transcription antitermination factor NusB [Ignavibacteria bacterium]|nr:transcription antitermination factor NusB [Ignavibacteria bacterium]
MQALYAFEISEQQLSALMEYHLLEFSNSEKDFVFARKLLIGTMEHRDEFDALLKEHAQHWELHRIALIDKILLRMGLFELLYCSEIPPKVSINEMIEIAKLYSTSESGKFVNGILDALHEKFKASGLMNKQGRGLLNETPASSQKKSKKSNVA